MVQLKFYKILNLWYNIGILKAICRIKKGNRRMNCKIIKAASQARRRNELHFLDRKDEILKEEEARRQQELEADQALAELCGYDPEIVSYR